MHVCTSAIVLNKVKHNDTTFITTLYTQELGSVSFAVRIPKTAKANIKPTLFQPLNIVKAEWDHHPEKSLQRLQSLHVEHPYSSLLYTPRKAAMATFLAEAIYHSTKQEQQGDLYTFIATSLLWLDNAPKNYMNFHIIFLIKLICELGFQPNTDNPAHYHYFDLQDAEYTPVQPFHNYYLRHCDARHIPIFTELDYTNMHRAKLSLKAQNRILHIITTYYKLHISGFPNLKSTEILNELLAL